MAGINLPVLQSGFVALSENGFVLPEVEEQSLVKTLQHGIKQDPLASYFYNAEIDELFNEWMNDVKIMNDFYFRERLLKAAMTVFGAPLLSNWLEIQLKYAYAGAMHRQFLQDTLVWITDSNPNQERTVEPMQWLNLVKPEASKGKLNDSYNEVVDQTLKRWTNNALLQPSNLSIKNFIQQWVSNEDGYEDMLICLQVIFGRRGRVAKTA